MNEKMYYVATASSTGGEGNLKLNIITNKEKVSEIIFNDLLKAKLLELLGEENKDQYDKCFNQVSEALENKKPVNVLDRSFEIKFKKIKK